MGVNFPEIDSRGTSVGSTTTANPWTVLTELFEAFDDSGLVYAVLGDTTSFPHLDGGDIDLAMDQNGFHKLESILSSVDRSNGLRLVQMIEHEQSSRFYILAWKGVDGRPAFLQLDVCTDYFRSGELLMSAQEFLSSRVLINVHGSSFYVPSPEAAVTYYLVKKIKKGAISVGQARYLVSTLEQVSPENQSRLAKRFGFSARPAFMDWVDGLGSTGKSVATLSSFDPNVRTKLIHRVREFTRLAKRTLSPNGLFVVMMGPDGSGKTTINNLSREYIGTAFWSVQYLHFRPFVGVSDNDDEVVEDPHADPPRDTVSSIAKLIYYVFDYIFGYILKIRPCMSRSGLVIFDRYYEDMQIDQLRYRYGGPTWLLGIVGKFVPRPDLYVFLDVDADVIQSRKQEVPFEETERQVESYRRLAKRLPNATLCDASQAPEEVAVCVSWKMLDALSDRTSRRLGGRS